MKPPQIAIQAIDPTGTIQSIRSRKIKRIYHFIQTAKSSEIIFKLRVAYQHGLTNEGVYKTTEQLTHALHAFMEKD